MSLSPEIQSALWGAIFGLISSLIIEFIKRQWNKEEKHDSQEPPPKILRPTPEQVREYGRHLRDNSPEEPAPEAPQPTPIPSAQPNAIPPLFRFLAVGIILIMFVILLQVRSGIPLSQLLYPSTPTPTGVPTPGGGAVEPPGVVVSPLPWPLFFIGLVFSMAAFYAVRLAVRQMQ